MEKISKFFRFGLKENLDLNSLSFDKNHIDNIRKEVIFALEKKYLTENIDVKALVESYYERKENPIRLVETGQYNPAISDEEIFLQERTAKENFEKIQNELLQKNLKEGIQSRMNSFGKDAIGD